MATILILAKIVLVSALFISLPIGSHENQNLRTNTTRSIANTLETMEMKYDSLKRKVNVNSENANRNIFNAKAGAAFPSDLFTASETTNATRNSTDNFTVGPVSPPPFSSSPSLIHGFVSKLPLNSSISTKYFSTASAQINSTDAMSTENFTWSLNNSTMKTDNISATVGFLSPTPTPSSGTPLTTEPTRWLTTSSYAFAGFTPYQENATLQPTLKFTNNSKLFPNTSDSPKENKNTGIVFGAILGAILCVSLLTLIGYLLYGKKKTDSFSHQRLYEDRNEPVLRLDNSPEPYDVSFGNSSYYTSSVNGAPVPESREHAHDGIPMDDIPPLRTSV
ncbi:mucin-15 [Perognathus longimembris pacificus]|uniref:mucin-15 n=1 Tax=Perognathus longimembris pacificus TaxID=214514 RepID=UPI002019CD29|nr:mucin-15 [Perognathus longimembris pacificus]